MQCRGQLLNGGYVCLRSGLVISIAVSLMLPRGGRRCLPPRLKSNRRTDSRAVRLVEVVCCGEGRKAVVTSNLKVSDDGH